MSKTVKCDCEEWEEYMPLIKGAQENSQNHHGLPYPEKAVFKFCPWCGVELYDFNFGGDS